MVDPGQPCPPQPQAPPAATTAAVGDEPFTLRYDPTTPPGCTSNAEAVVFAVPRRGLSPLGLLSAPKWAGSSKRQYERGGARLGTSPDALPSRATKQEANMLVDFPRVKLN